jgi:hypothetical protein
MVNLQPRCSATALYACWHFSLMNMIWTQLHVTFSLGTKIFLENPQCWCNIWMSSLETGHLPRIFCDNPVSSDVFLLQRTCCTLEVVLSFILYVLSTSVNSQGLYLSVSKRTGRRMTRRLLSLRVLNDGGMVCLLDILGFVHFGTQVRGFAPEGSRQIFGTKRFSARLSSEGN